MYFLCPLPTTTNVQVGLLYTSHICCTYRCTRNLKLFLESAWQCIYVACPKHKSEAGMQGSTIHRLIHSHIGIYYRESCVEGKKCNMYHGKCSSTVELLIWNFTLYEQLVGNSRMVFHVRGHAEPSMENPSVDPQINGHVHCRSTYARIRTAMEWTLCDGIPLVELHPDVLTWNILK